MLSGRGREEIDAAAFARLAAPYDHVLVDIGTGDGAFPYRLAAAHPRILCLGLDPNAAGMADSARKVRRKPARGGRRNAGYIVASLERPPRELRGCAAAITINFPWAALLEHILALRPGGTSTLARTLNTLAAPACALQFLLNEVTDLPALPSVDPGGLADRLARAFTSAGFGLPEATWLDHDARVSSRWGGRLIRGSNRRVVRLRSSRGDVPEAIDDLLRDAVGAGGP